MSRTEVTIAGVGGQGSILAGVILGTAAVTYENRYAVQTQAYSSELRGGFAAAWVVIDQVPVVFPRVTNPDILVAQAQDSIQRFFASLKPEGVLIVDSDMVRQVPEHPGRIVRVPATSIARNEIGTPVTANMVILGALCQATGVVGAEALEAAIGAAVPPSKVELNLKAFHLGRQAVASSGKAPA